MTLPGGTGVTTTTIDYTYDPLYRLTAADYSTGDTYRYAYDAVGNRLQQQTSVNGQQSTVGYQYDIANRLTNVGGVDYTWDANGNLLNDGASTYTYDPANRMRWIENRSAIYATLSAGYGRITHGIRYAMMRPNGMRPKGRPMGRPYINFFRGLKPSPKASCAWPMTINACGSISWTMDFNCVTSERVITQ